MSGHSPFYVLSPNPYSSLRVESSLQPLPIKLLFSSQDTGPTQLPLEILCPLHRLCLALITLAKKVISPYQT